MSKVVIFWTYIPNFFDDLFFSYPQNFFASFFFKHPQIFWRPFFLRHPQIFFRLYRPKNCFLALKIHFFRPRKNFLDLLDLKISLNILKTLRKHLFSLQIDEENNIF